MRLTSAMSQDEVRAALNEAAAQTWGPERLDALRSTLDAAAKAIWTVLQVPLAPLSEEPDLPVQPGRAAREG